VLTLDIIKVMKPRRMWCVWHVLHTVAIYSTEPE